MVVRVPVRVVVLVLVVPVRMGWDALVVAGRFLNDAVLRPVGRVLFVWPLVGLWRYVLVPLGKGLAWLGNVLVVVPLGWLYRYVLTPLGHGIAWAVRYVVLVPAAWVYAWVLTPVGHGVRWALYWITRVVLVLPALALWRWVLVPVGRVLAVVGREVGDALGHAWRIAGHLSLAVGRFLATLFRWIFAEPVRWVYRTLLTPVGHVVRDVVLRPVAEATREVLASVRETARQARADFRRMLLGEPREPVAVDRREPTGPETRTLGRSTTALTKD